MHKLEKTQWSVVIQCSGSQPYVFRFNSRKDAYAFAKDGNFGKRKISIYKTVNSIIKKWS